MPPVRLVTQRIGEPGVYADVFQRVLPDKPLICVAEVPLAAPETVEFAGGNNHGNRFTPARQLYFKTGLRLIDDGWKLRTR